VTNDSLARSYLAKARVRLKVLDVLRAEGAWSDVVREAQEVVEGLAAISAWLRKEREFSFYGDVDFIPTDQYAETDARRAIDDATFVVAAVSAEIDRT
jgi:hypothetical protein